MARHTGKTIAEQAIDELTAAGCGLTTATLAGSLEKRPESVRSALDREARKTPNVVCWRNGVWVLCEWLHDEPSIANDEPEFSVVDASETGGWSQCIDEIDEVIDELEQVIVAVAGLKDVREKLITLGQHAELGAAVQATIDRFAAGK